MCGTGCDMMCGTVSSVMSAVADMAACVLATCDMAADVANRLMSAAAHGTAGSAAWAAVTYAATGVMASAADCAAAAMTTDGALGMPDAATGTRRAVIAGSGAATVSVGIPLYGGCTMSSVTAALLSVSKICRQQDEQE